MEGLMTLDALFDNEDLLREDEKLMLEDEDFLTGLETPLTATVAFNEGFGGVVNTQMEPKEVGTNKDNAMKMISYLQEQLRAKDEEIQRLRKSDDEDDFEKIVDDVVDDEAAWSSLLPPGALKLEEVEVEDMLTPSTPTAAILTTPTFTLNTTNCNDKVSPTNVACTKKRKFEGRAQQQTMKNGRKKQQLKALSPMASTSSSCYSDESDFLDENCSLDGNSNGKPAMSTLLRMREENNKAKMSLETIVNSDKVIPPERPKKTARRWTPEQDEQLRVAVTKHNGQNWKSIAQMVTDRDHVQCLQRWKKVLQPGLVKGMWTAQEDELLLKLMSTSQPKNWADIASKVPGRTAKQCRERWSLNLDPSINRGAWTQEEDELLLKLHAKLGNRWAEIKRHLKGRTENGVKTRFKSIERARTKDKEVVWTPELESQLHDIAVRFDCRIDEVAKHLPRALRGISSQAMRDHCPLLREAELKNANTAEPVIVKQENQ